MPILNMGFGLTKSALFIDPPKQKVFLPFYYIAYLSFAYVSSAFYVYIYIPGWDIIFAVKNLCCHASFKNSVQAEYHATMPAKKLFEQIGEALPQFSIAATFYILNWRWLSKGDKLMGVVTMTLSAGSIMMGLVRGCMVVYSKEGSLKNLISQGGAKMPIYVTPPPKMKISKNIL